MGSPSQKDSDSLPKPEPSPRRGTSLPRRERKVRYRAAAYPQLPRLVADARAAGALGACLSGAGSSIIAFTDTIAGVARIESAFRAAAADTDLPGRVEVIAPRNAGARVIPEA